MIRNGISFLIVIVATQDVIMPTVTAQSLSSPLAVQMATQAVPQQPPAPVISIIRTTAQITQVPPLVIQPQTQSQPSVQPQSQSPPSIQPQVNTEQAAATTQTQIIQAPSNSIQSQVQIATSLAEITRDSPATLALDPLGQSSMQPTISITRSIVLPSMTSFVDFGPLVTITNNPSGTSTSVSNETIGKSESPSELSPGTKIALIIVAITIFAAAIGIYLFRTCALKVFEFNQSSKVFRSRLSRDVEFNGAASIANTAPTIVRIGDDSTVASNQPSAFQTLDRLQVNRRVTFANHSGQYQVGGYNENEYRYDGGYVDQDGNWAQQQPREFQHYVTSNASDDHYHNSRDYQYYEAAPVPSSLGTNQVGEYAPPVPAKDSIDNPSGTDTFVSSSP